MFAALFRGIVVVGVVGWYSTAVWKMIDEYFKDQFQKYLREEYEKNPKMRADLDAYNRSDIAEPNITDIANRTSELDGRLGVRSSNGDQAENVTLSSIGAAGHADSTNKEDARQSESILETDTIGVDSEKVRKEVASAADEIAVHEYSKPPESGNKDSPRIKIADKSEREIESKIHRRRRWNRNRRKPEIAAKVENQESKTRKRKVKTIHFTDSDFEKARKKMKLNDHDFSEFDDDDRQLCQEPLEGIPTRNLPYKPRVEIYDLERISEEEFCPLSLIEDEMSCDETRTWP